MELHEIMLLLMLAAAVVLGASWAAGELGSVVEWFADPDLDTPVPIPLESARRR